MAKMAGRKMNPTEEINELKKLCSEQKLIFALAAIEKLTPEFIKAAEKAREAIPNKKLSPFLYQLR